MMKIYECDMKKFDTLDITDIEKTTAVLRARWWPQAAKQEGDRTIVFFNSIHGKNVSSLANAGGVSIWSRNGAPPRKGCVATDQMTKASNRLQSCKTAYETTRAKKGRLIFIAK